MKRIAQLVLCSAIAVSLGSCAAPSTTSATDAASSEGQETQSQLTDEATSQDSAAQATDSSADSTGDEEKPRTGPNSKAAKLVDYGWVAFEVPVGFSELEAEGGEVALRKDDAKDVEVRLRSTVTAESGNANALADAREGEAPDSNIKSETVVMGERVWIPVYFKAEGGRGVYLFCDISDQHVVEVAARGISPDDAGMRTILETLVFDEAMIG